MNKQDPQQRNTLNIRRKIQFHLLLAFYCLLLIGGCAASPPTKKNADFYYKMGLSALNEGDVQNAFVQFQTAMRLDEHNKDVLNSLGLVYLQLEDYDKSIELFQRAVSRDESFSDAYNNLGVVYIKKRQWDNALDAFKRAVDNPLFRSPDRAFFNMGLCYYRIGRYDTAVGSFRDAAMRNSQFPLPFYWLALTYNRTARYGEAAAALTRGLELDPAYAGDRKKFEDNVRKKLPLSEGLEEQDYLDYLDILKY